MTKVLKRGIYPFRLKKKGDDIKTIMQKNKIIKFPDKSSKGIVFLAYTGIAIIILGLVIGVMFLITGIVQQTSGFDTPKNTVKTVLDGLSNNDKSKLRSVLYLSAADYHKRLDDLCNIAKEISASYKFDLDKINISETKWDYDNANIHSSKLLKVTVPADITVTAVFKTNVCYNMRVYNINNKWYVYDIKETSVIINDISDYDVSDLTQTVGDKTIGTISLTDAWAVSDSSNLTYCCISSTGKITVTAEDSSESVDTTVNKLCKDLSKNTYSSVSDTVLNGIPCKKISVHNEDGTYTYVFVFKQIMKDAYIHCIRLDTSDEFTDYPYVTTYLS